MKCALCNNKLIHQTGTVEFKSRSLGNISVPDLEYMECKSCGDKLLSPEMSDRMIDFIAGKERAMINTLPVGEFVTLNEASAILGISKQAFSKHPKIKRGFIYSVNIGGRKLYHRRSASQFKLTGDGRFQLTGWTEATLGFIDWKHIASFPNVAGALEVEIYEHGQYAGSLEAGVVHGSTCLYEYQDDMPSMKAGSIEVGAMLQAQATYKNQYDMP